MVAAGVGLGRHLADEIDGRRGHKGGASAPPFSFVDNQARHLRGNPAVAVPPDDTFDSSLMKARQAPLAGKGGQEASSAPQAGNKGGSARSAVGRST